MDDLLNRISVDPKVMVGKPVIRGTRITVEHIMNELAIGMSAAEIVAEYQPRLTEDDVRAACAYAAALLSGERTDPLAAE
ncbi:MAG TPA: DUF433 domain-containing protein [Rhizomicrobium sp.]|jgi:uncharacterized protein (DUF433 family)|nr:DUF433 domain-containing protein [Rhizomicrobium sp.]